MKTLKIFLSETTRPKDLIYGMWHHLIDFKPKLLKLCLWGKIWIRLGGHMFYIGLKKGKHEKILFETTRYEASSSGPLPSLFKLCSWGQKLPRPRVTFYIGLYRENIDTSSHLKPQGLEP